MKKAEKTLYQQAGVMGFRNADGSITSRPIYIKVDEKEINPCTGMPAQEEKVLSDIAELFAEKFAQYVDGCRAQGIELDI